MSTKDRNSTFSVVVGDDKVSSSSPQVERHGVGRPFLGVHFECCNTYARIYKTREGTAYEGQCPHCFARISVGIGKGGTSKRFFRAG